MCSYIGLNERETELFLAMESFVEQSEYLRQIVMNQFGNAIKFYGLNENRNDDYTKFIRDKEFLFVGYYAEY